jgi:hypothetical protein
LRKKFDFFKYFSKKAKNLVKDYLSGHLIRQKAEGRRQKTEDRGQRTEDGSQMTEDR